MNLEKFLNPKSVAVVGVSKDPSKVGSTIFLNLKRNGFLGNVYAINPKHKEVFGYPCFPSIKELPKKPELIVVATPAKTVPNILLVARRMGVKRAIVISGGFGESGNKSLEKKFMRASEGMEVMGPNCLGVYNSRTQFDTLFFSLHKLERPRHGDVAIISQSGGVGSTFLGLAAEEGVGVHSFISYGNAYRINESNLLMELAKRKDVGKILLYLEGVSDGREFTKSLLFASKRKPVIVLKAGKSGKAKKAATTHTGSIAGDYLVYRGVFRRAGVVEASSFEEMYDFVKIFSQPPPKGKRLGIITNGGGLGVMATDEAEKLGLELAQVTQRTKRKLVKTMPSYVTPTNPLDIVADADVGRYVKAIEAMVNDGNVDMLLVNVLLQPPKMDTSLVENLQRFMGKKPMAVVVPGGKLEENLRRMLTLAGIPAYAFPERAVRALYSLYIFSNSSATL